VQETLRFKNSQDQIYVRITSNLLDEAVFWYGKMPYGIDVVEEQSYHSDSIGLTCINLSNLQGHLDSFSSETLIVAKGLEVQRKDLQGPGAG
jgi:hypothetical protein